MYLVSSIYVPLYSSNFICYLFQLAHSWSMGRWGLVSSWFISSLANMVWMEWEGLFGNKLLYVLATSIDLWWIEVSECSAASNQKSLALNVHSLNFLPFPELHVPEFGCNIASAYLIVTNHYQDYGNCSIVIDDSGCVFSLSFIAIVLLTYSWFFSCSLHIIIL